MARKLSVKRLVISVFVLAIIVIGLVIGFSGDDNDVEAAPLKIGFIGPLTGEAAVYGVLDKNSAVLAVEEINSNGGVNGKLIEMIYEDGKCTRLDATSAA